MGRIGLSCLLPASWHFSISPVGCPRILNTNLRQIVVISVLAAAVSLLYFSVVIIRNKYGRLSRDRKFQRYLARVTDIEATDTNNPNVNYGIVVDCGSSGSRIFVYCWPRHNSNPHDLLDIRQMRDKNRKPVVMKIKPGVYAWIGINFVLGRFEHIEDDDEAVVEVNLPGSESSKAILRKRTAGILDMGGVSTQIAYEVPKTEEVAKNLLAEFNLGCDVHQTEHVYRVYVATFLGFGGNAARQRYEDRIFASTVQKNRLLGKQTGLTPDTPYLDPCLPLDIKDEIQQNGQTLFLRGTGDFDLCRETIQPFMNKTNETQTSLNGVYQPPIHFQNSEFYGFSEFYYCTEDVLRMGGDYSAAAFTRAAKVTCKETSPPRVLGRPVRTATGPRAREGTVEGGRLRCSSLGVLSPCLGERNRAEAKSPLRADFCPHSDYCATKWSVLRERFDRGLYASHADLHRLKYQCFKSAWMFEVFHRGFSFPINYRSLKTALQVYDKEVQWTLGAILYRTRFLPLRDIQQETFRASHAHWRGFSFVYNHYLFSGCFLVVLLAILLYLLRLRRIHRRGPRSGTTTTLWLEEGLPSQKIAGTL
ncbi:ectonucleoside triphosphate diphosphohydrolase 4 [Camelus ferus]|nr:ectonucleoside triphosphate diphosphohydrolase 4 [Camelus ferus]